MAPSTRARRHSGSTASVSRVQMAIAAVVVGAHGRIGREGAGRPCHRPDCRRARRDSRPAPTAAAIAAPSAPVSLASATVTGTPSPSAKICGQCAERAPPPDSAARPKADARLRQHLDVAAVLEHHALEQRAQHVPLVVPAGQAEEAAALVRAQPTAIEERVEERIVMRRRGARRPASLTKPNGSS